MASHHDFHAAMVSRHERPCVEAHGQDLGQASVGWQRDRPAAAVACEAVTQAGRQHRGVADLSQSAPSRSYMGLHARDSHLAHGFSNGRHVSHDPFYFPQGQHFGHGAAHVPAPHDGYAGWPLSSPALATMEPMHGVHQEVGPYDQTFEDPLLSVKLIAPSSAAQPAMVPGVHVARPAVPPFDDGDRALLSGPAPGSTQHSHMSLHVREASADGTPSDVAQAMRSGGSDHGALGDRFVALSALGAPPPTSASRARASEAAARRSPQEGAAAQFIPHSDDLVPNVDGAQRTSTLQQMLAHITGDTPHNGEPVPHSSRVAGALSLAVLEHLPVLAAVLPTLLVHLDGVAPDACAGTETTPINATARAWCRRSHGLAPRKHGHVRAAAVCVSCKLVQPGYPIIPRIVPRPRGCPSGVARSRHARPHARSKL